MWKIILVLCLATCSTACSAAEANRVPRTEDFVGTYIAEHVIDTVERLWLVADGSFTFEFAAVLGEVSGYRGRWTIRKNEIILFAPDNAGQEVEFPLQVLRERGQLSLIYSDESYVSAKATMLLPNAYRRTSKDTSGMPVIRPSKD